MKDIIFYFSGTGNSYSVAQKLDIKDADIINICVADIKEYAAEKIGFVYPSYCMEPPKIVQKFMQTAKFSCKYCFIITTCGGDSANAAPVGIKILKKNGAIVNYTNSIILPDSCIIFASSEGDKKRFLAEESAAVAGFSKDIASGKENTTRFKPIYKLLTSLSWFGIKYYYGARNKRTNDNCTKCHLCVDECPLGNISCDKSGAIVFGDKCEYCFKCIHTCPNAAIEFGRLKVDDKTRYLHP